MTDERTYGLNRSEGRTHPGAVPTTIVQPDSPDYLAPANRAKPRHTGERHIQVDRMANTSAIAVRTRVDVIPGERLTAADSGFMPRAKTANWRDYRGG